MRLRARVVVYGRECVFDADGDERTISEAFAWWCSEVMRLSVHIQWQNLWK